MHDLQFRRFGKLAVVCPIKKRNKWGYIIWLCRCDCGNLTTVISSYLVDGDTKSCGCLRKKKVYFGLNFKHGDNRSRKKARLYNIWAVMKERCSNPNNPSYKNYGGRGISVCTEWQNDYLAFKEWALANGYASNLTIDRIDNDGNYEPSNCQWITKSENSIKSNKERDYKRRTHGK